MIHTQQSAAHDSDVGSDSRVNFFIARCCVRVAYATVINPFVCLSVYLWIVYMKPAKNIANFTSICTILSDFH